MFAFPYILLAAFVLTSYLVVSFYTSGICRRWSKGKRVLLNVCVAIVCGLLCNAVRLLAVAVMHLLALLLLEMALHWCAGRLWKGASWRRGIIPLIAVVLLMGYGVFNLNHVQQTVYRIPSEKLQRDYRIVFLADIHYGTIQNPDVLEEKVGQINALQPDVIILGGDILDESVGRDEMQACFAALGQLKAEYGCYFVYGNHDRQRYSQNPAYTAEELQLTIEENGIRILSEELVQIGDDLQLLGREDLDAPQDRHSAEHWLREIDPECFLLAVDHQPFAPMENAQLGADVQLSGHTHGGQVFPLAWLPAFFKGYVYGSYQVEDMLLLVSSGFAGWGFPVRTQGISEYVVLEMVANEA